MGKKLKMISKAGINCTAVPSTIIRLAAPDTKYFICHNTFKIILFILQLMVIQMLCQ